MRLGKQKAKDDPAMAQVRRLWEAKQREGWTMQQLGERMGYPADSARKSVSQFLKSHDPHVTTLRRFCKALEMPVADLFTEGRR